MVICPQAPLETPIGPESVGYAWYPMSLGGPPDIDAIMASRQQLQAFLDECLKSYLYRPAKAGNHRVQSGWGDGV